MAKEYRDVARITHIYRYPIKSMAGESLAEAKIGWHGIAEDRRYAFVCLEKNQDCRGFRRARYHS